MLVLAIECSSRRGSVALLEDERPLGETLLRSDQRSAESLLPAISELLVQTSLTPAAVELVAVTSGPGSFTGLRVGVTAAKCFAYACRAGVYAVNTLRVIAAQVPGKEDALIIPVMDAQRSQLFAGRYRREAGRLLCQTATELVQPLTFLEELADNAILTGPGMLKLPPQASPPRSAPQPYWTPLAITVGRLAAEDSKRDGFQFSDDPFSLLPDYYRLSAAEEKLRRGTQS